MAMTSKKNNRKCIVCGQNYTYCNHCDSDKLKPTWFAIFHDQNCHDIYDAVANILPQQGKESAKEALDKLDLSNKENFHQNIVKSINEIYDIVDEVVIQDDVKEVKETTENNEETKETVEEVKDEVKSEEVKDDNIVKPTASTEFANEVTNKTSNEVTKKTSTRSKSKK